jgi:DEAD/DEAH box helicase domain-containing protein
MLPATIAADIQRQVLHYLEATFEFRDPEVQEALNRFLLDPQRGLFKGPWLQVRRPYRAAPSPWQNPFDCAIAFHPFKHQDLAWKRLLSTGRTPQHTLVTTGTGSGKSECFFYPLLDHCRRMNKAGQKGIKAIILYPMNALAADQVGRLAKIILPRYHTIA